MSNFMAGAIVVLAGGMLTVTGIGAILGIPITLLGLAIMFPNAAKVFIALAFLGVVALSM